MIETIARCNQCKSIRDPEKNHWSLIFFDKDYFSVTTWDDARATDAKEHVCGDDCIKAALNAHLNRRRDARAAEQDNQQLEKKLLKAKDHTKLGDKPDAPATNERTVTP